MFSNASSRDVPARAFAGGGEPAEPRRAASSKDGPSSVGSSEPLVGAAASPAAPRSIAARRAGVPPREPRSESTASLRRSSYSSDAETLLGRPRPRPGEPEETGETGEPGPGVAPSDARGRRASALSTLEGRSKVVRRSFAPRPRPRPRPRPGGRPRRGPLVLLLRPPRSPVSLLLRRRFRRGAPLRRRRLGAPLHRRRLVRRPAETRRLRSRRLRLRRLLRRRREGLADAQEVFAHAPPHAPDRLPRLDRRLHPRPVGRLLEPRQTLAEERPLLGVEPSRDRFSRRSGRRFFSGTTRFSGFRIFGILGRDLRVEFRGERLERVEDEARRRARRVAVEAAVERRSRRSFRDQLFRDRALDRLRHLRERRVREPRFFRGGGPVADRFFPLLDPPRGGGGGCIFPRDNLVADRLRLVAYRPRHARPQRLPRLPRLRSRRRDVAREHPRGGPRLAARRDARARAPLDASLERAHPLGDGV